jgi:hypothetical protein
MTANENNCSAMKNLGILSSKVLKRLRWKAFALMPVCEFSSKKLGQQNALHFNMLFERFIKFSDCLKQAKAHQRFF